jgi:DNA mismatch repair protein MutL
MASPIERTVMNRIRILPDHVVNKIAAGEVVERPASVVKELLENSIDAGASQVSIDLRDAGHRLIRVIDNGSGIDREEITLALQRHATSKISTDSDLEGIRSLGFRGEALPAIFSVSRLALTSKVPSASIGSLVRGEAGQIETMLEVESADGTTLEISDLFFNMPARLKFLKSSQTELAAVLKIVTQLALAHPAVHLRLTHNGKSLLNSPAAKSLRDRIGTLYGFDAAQKLLEVSRQGKGVTIAGLISPPSLARRHRNDMFYIVNGRPVRDTLLVQTLLEAYRPLLPRDQFPLSLIVIDVGPEELDVNVHPTKAWVRFRQLRQVQECLFEAVKAALNQMEVIPASLSAAPMSVEFSSPADGSQSPFQGALFQETLSPYRHTLFGELVGQIQETFIVSASQDEVFFIDQHVAHERVLFDRMKTALDAGLLQSQELLFPEPLELQPAHLAVLADWQPTLARLGFTVEEFGGQSVLLRSAPAILNEPDSVRLIDALLSEIGEPLGAEQAMLDRVLAFIACRAAVKAHEALQRDEMTQLLLDLSASSTPYFCPHGRPIVSRLPLGEIKRELKRDWE